MIDSHCHLTDPYYGGGEDIIKNMAADGLEALVTVGYDARTSAECARLAANDGVYATVGLHPGEIKEGDDLGGILPLLRLPKVVALGEIGLSRIRVRRRPCPRRDIPRRLFPFRSPCALRRRATRRARAV